jgi:beta-glucosidase-like glycosyl hydrolase
MASFWSPKTPLAGGLLSTLALTACIGAAGCSSAADESTDDDDAALSTFNGTPNEDIGQFFMIEHYGVVANGYPDVHDMVKKKNLGALILWNPQQASGEVAGQMVAAYAKSAKASGHPEPFVSADQEERGTQRFKSQNGFTNLVDGATLGRVVAREGNARVCELHAQITSREMAAAGLNMALGTVSDIYTHDSGTPGMFRSRAIDSRSEIVASCIRAMTAGYAAEGHVVFVTKHFPGLGNASGNTDVDPRVRSYSDTQSETEAELAPYRAATSSVNGDGSWPLFGAMVSHASYKILDRTESPATLSSAILHDVVRGDASRDLPPTGVDKSGQPASFKGLGLQGLTVSDAFWTWGAMKNLSPIDKRRLMARSFLAGMDVLMIAKAEFAGGWDYFQNVYAGTLDDAEKAAFVHDANERDWESLQTKFKARVAESAARIKAVKSRVGPAAPREGEARATSRDLSAEYSRLTQ